MNAATEPYLVSHNRPAEDALAAVEGFAPFIEDLALSIAADEMAARTNEARLGRQVEELQVELTAARQELRLLHSRDDTIDLHMRRMDEELRLAARLQEDFLPKTLPQIGRVRFHTLYRPANYVSGDLYDVTRLTEKHIGFYMADAVGHGVPAALLAMFIKNALITKEILPATGYRLLEPSESLGKLNLTLLDQNLAHATFATAVYGHINVETLEVTMSRAGHPHPIILHADGSVTVMETEGSLLGIFADEIYVNATTTLRAGDKMVFYTDGVEVAFKYGQAMDAAEWIIELQKRASLSGAELVASIADHLNITGGSLAPKDDVTLVVMEIE